MRAFKKLYSHWVYKLAIDAMAQANNCWMGEVQPNVRHCGKDVLEHTKWWNDSATRKPNTKTQACARFQACVMRIKRHVRNDDGKWIFIQTFKNVFLMMIIFFLKIVWKACVINRQRLCISLKCVWNGNKPKLQKYRSCKTLEVLIKAAIPQFPKYSIRVMVSMEMKPILTL